MAAGVACTAYDVVVNSNVVEVLKEREGMREFVLELMISHIETKHSVALNRGEDKILFYFRLESTIESLQQCDCFLGAEYKILKNRKVMGVLQPQVCRVKNKVKEISKK